MGRRCDVVVIGAGHAGCEAALAAARLGCEVVLLSPSRGTVGLMSCNPAIGGLAKGQLVREIDALGGQMALATDAAMLQFRMLNTRKGVAVRSPRAQCDRAAYAAAVLAAVEEQPRLELMEGLVEEVLVRGGRVAGVVTREGARVEAKSVVLAAGTFLRGRILVGDAEWGGGRDGEPAAENLSGCLERLGFEVRRFKTGTPPRVDAASVDFDSMRRQDGDVPIVPFSFEHDSLHLEQIPCWLTNTTPRTHDLVRGNLNRSALYGGRIRSTGVRYCPSLEDKVVKFSKKDRHLVFVEPEGRDADEFYLNGVSNSLPAEIQERMVRSIPGLEEARITRYGYAIEYDFLPPLQLGATLESKAVEGLFPAGQVNGTTGYEEAAAQGLVAGVNAAAKVRGAPPLILPRHQAYIGVLIDDLVTRGVDEPYRMFTSRAEFRLLLRADNADRRLTPTGRRVGLVRRARWLRFAAKERAIRRVTETLKGERRDGKSLFDALRRPEVAIRDLLESIPRLSGLPPAVLEQVEIDAKYAGYIERQSREIARLRDLQSRRIPRGFDFWSLSTIKYEAREKLSRVRPENLARAARVPGVTPADLLALMTALSGRRPLTKK